MDALARVAVDVARLAGEGLLIASRNLADLEVRSKESATDPVSEADEASERSIVEGLTAAFPDDGILGEEDSGNRPGSSGRRWVIDPLDGTVNFLYGSPLWCISIACEDSDGALVGVVHHPPSGETFVAVRSGGAWLHHGDDRTPLSVTRPRDVASTLVATGFSYDVDVRRDQGRLLGHLLSNLRDIRRGGAAALDLAWTAAGRVDGYLEFDLKRWDWAAGRLLVTEAGGAVDDVERRLGGQVRAGLAAGSADTVVRLGALLSTARSAV